MRWLLDTVAELTEALSTNMVALWIKRTTTSHRTRIPIQLLRMMHIFNGMIYPLGFPQRDHEGYRSICTSNSKRVKERGGAGIIRKQQQQHVASTATRRVRNLTRACQSNEQLEQKKKQHEEYKRLQALVRHRPPLKIDIPYCDSA